VLEALNVVPGERGSAVGIAGGYGSQQRAMLLHVAGHSGDPVQHQTPDAGREVVVLDQGIPQVRVVGRVVDGAVDVEIRANQRWRGVAAVSSSARSSAWAANASRSEGSVRSAARAAAAGSRSIRTSDRSDVGDVHVVARD
jgi:hypothetical protein